MSKIDEDLNLIVLEKEYDKLKNALSMKYSEIGYEEIKRAINEISDHTFTAARILARAIESQDKFLFTYDQAWAQMNTRAVTELEKLWASEKRKTTLTERRVRDYILLNFKDEVGLLEAKKSQMERDISIIQSLHRRLEMRETLLQTYSRLHERRSQIIIQEHKNEVK